MRFDFQLLRMPAERADPTVIQSWRTGLNAEPGDRVPVRLPEKDPEQAAGEIVSAARRFLAGG